jgi:hypothetical protein
MKVVKFILGGLFLISALGMFGQKEFLTGLIFASLGLVFLPPISENLKQKFKLWQSKAVRYITYVALFILSGVFISNRDAIKSYNEETAIKKNPEASTISTDKEKAIVFNGNGEKVGEKIIDKEQEYKNEVENEFQNDDSDFWEKFDPIVKRRVYDLIKNKDCEGLQKEYNITADNLDRIHNSGGTSSRNLDLMFFLDEKMKDIGCYKIN